MWILLDSWFLFYTRQAISLESYRFTCFSHSCSVVVKRYMVYGIRLPTYPDHNVFKIVFQGCGAVMVVCICLVLVAGAMYSSEGFTTATWWRYPSSIISSSCPSLKFEWIYEFYVASSRKVTLLLVVNLYGSPCITGTCTGNWNVFEL